MFGRRGALDGLSERMREKKFDNNTKRYIRPNRGTKKPIRDRLGSVYNSNNIVYTIVEYIKKKKWSLGRVFCAPICGVCLTTNSADYHDAYAAHDPSL